MEFSGHGLPNEGTELVLLEGEQEEEFVFEDKIEGVFSALEHIAGKLQTGIVEIQRQAPLLAEGAEEDMTLSR